MYLEPQLLRQIIKWNVIDVVCLLKLLVIQEEVALTYAFLHSANCLHALPVNLLVAIGLEQLVFIFVECLKLLIVCILIKWQLLLHLLLDQLLLFRFCYFVVHRISIWVPALFAFAGFGASFGMLAARDEFLVLS